MVPSPVPVELQRMTQIEEMLIARALPIITVYIKPGGQRAYSGHCINLPQNITELANSLPHYPKGLCYCCKMKGKNNIHKDVAVRKKKVEDALNWLISHNQCYRNINVNEKALQSLPENGIPPDLITTNSLEENVRDTDNDFDVTPNLSDEDIVFDKKTQMTSFLPISQNELPENDALQQELSNWENTMNWPYIDDQPLSEFSTSYLATMAFPCLFPDGLGDSTNPALLRDIPFYERIKHLIKFAEKKGRKMDSSI